MPDHFREVTHTGYGKRVGNSFGGIVIGVILFFASFVVLFNNEGAVDFSLIAKTAVQIDPSQELADPALKDKLLSATGTLTTTEELGDDLYLKPGKYIALERRTEMYAWVEKKNSQSETEVGGGETTTTTYDYVKEWTDSPQSSGNFRYPEGHQNPVLEIKSANKRVASATIGLYGIEMSGVTLPSLTGLTLNTENTVLNPPAASAQSGAAATGGVAATSATTAPTQPSGLRFIAPARLESGEYVYLSKTEGSTFSSPAVGDVRVSYSALKDGVDVTVFGKLTGKTFGTYLDPNNNRFFQIFTGSREDAIAGLHESYVMTKWIWRGAGFFMMWIGLGMVLGPLSVIMDFLPFLGGLSRSLVGAVTFVVALVLSGVTILISMLFHNIVALVVVIVAISALVFMVLQQKKSQSSATKLPPIGNTPAGGPPSGPPAGPGAGT